MVTMPGTDPTRSIMYYINDGVYASFNCLLFDHAIVEPRVLMHKCRPTMHEVSLYE
jgi:ornithine decarboxylase